MNRFAPLFVVAALALAGCKTTGDGPSVTPGAGTPPTSGGATGMSAGLIDGSVGKSLSAADRRQALQAEFRALEHTASGKPVSWKSGDNSGDVVAAQPYRVGSQDCRLYTHTVFPGSGAAQTARGTACRNPDGTWTPLT